MMQIKMLSIQCGPGGNFHPGDLCEVSAVEAQVLLSGGFAVAVSPPPERAIIEPDELGIIVPLEAAIIGPAETRGRGRPRKI